jgi:hypothetical protein
LDQGAGWESAIGSSGKGKQHSDVSGSVHPNEGTIAVGSAIFGHAIKIQVLALYQRTGWAITVQAGKDVQQCE